MEGFPEKQTVEENIKADLDFLSKYKDTDQIDALIVVPGLSPRTGSIDFVEPPSEFEEDSIEWHTYSVKELRGFIQQYQEKYNRDDVAEWPLSFRDPNTEEEHKTVFGKLEP